MLSAVRTFMKRYGGAVVGLPAALVTVVAATFNPTTVLAVATAIVGAGMATVMGFMAGRMRAHHELAEQLGRQPVSMHVNVDDDGNAVAFVQQVSGALITVQVPSDVLDDPRAVVAYVLDAIERG